MYYAIQMRFFDVFWIWQIDLVTTNSSFKKQTHLKCFASCYLKIVCVSFIIRASWKAPYIGTTSMM